MDVDAHLIWCNVNNKIFVGAIRNRVEVLALTYYIYNGVAFHCFF